ncbi:MAG: hypothetical protein JST59_21040 [Actinobacteria bacterium]|nr:hypothetical protein [Actinomycetota bacterium]
MPGAQGLSATATYEDGSVATIAGSRLFGLSLEAAFPSSLIPGATIGNQIAPVGSLRDLSFNLPQGIVVNPKATPIRCTEAQLQSESNTEGCPPEAQVGDVNLLTSNVAGVVPGPVALYNMAPPPDVPAEFAFGVKGVLIHVQGGLGGDVHLTATSRNILAKIGAIGVDAELWGNPTDPRHDYQRLGVNCNFAIPGFHGECPVRRTETPLLTMPSACSGPLQVEASAASWEEPEGVLPHTVAVPTTDTDGNPVGVTGCETLAFNPSISIRPTSHAADSPTGLNVELEVPQNEGLTTRATATLKKVVVHLPQGMAVNPSAADGLGACSPAQIGIGNNSPATCPDSAKVGTVEVETPLLESPLRGSVFLAEQTNNPFRALLALYVVVEGEGIVVKLPGRVDPDPATGQLTATFDSNPELPFSNFKLEFSGGSRATLVTPSACGSYTTETQLTSWASEGPVAINAPLIVNQGCTAGGFNPVLQAGTANPIGGAFSSFTLRITRQDGEQNLSRIDTTLPEGLVAKLAGVPLCGDAEAMTGNCPAGSQVGTTTTGVGAGTQPLYIPQPGKAPTAVYLAGPYKGAPYSLVVKVPAQAGPFDLGTIAVRVALNVDLFSAQVTAASDPLPQILEGIPVAYRDVRVNVDRQDFILNPTSCDPMKITSVLTSSTGATASPSDRFQVAGCERLQFKPQLKLQLKGATKRTGHPALKAVVTYPKEGAYANIARAQVGLPSSEFLDQGNLNKVCTQPQLRSDTCPKSSVYGHAKAWTPILERPLEGPVYLGVGFGYKLPALVADLNGQVRILLKGKVDTTKNKGLRNTFEAVPDAPVSRFVLEMKGGKKYGLLENSENICRKPQRASALFNAQNGDSLHLEPTIANSCKGKGSKKSKGAKGR